MKTILSALFILVFLQSTLSAQEKERIAVLPFKANGVSAEEANVITDVMRTMLVKTNKYTVLDRDNIDKILAEQDFQQTSYTTTDDVVKMGKLLNVQYIIIGTLARFGANFVLTANKINIESAEVEKSENIKAMTIDNMFYMAQNLAVKLMKLSGDTTAPATADADNKLQGIDYTGREIYEIFLKKALRWQPDAVLSEIKAIGALDSAGRASSWDLSFWSPSTKKLYSLAYYYNNDIRVEQPKLPVPNAPVIPNNAILDTKKIYDTAEFKGGAAPFTAQGYRPSASLYQPAVAPTEWWWVLNYAGGDHRIVHFVDIDALTGEVVGRDEGDPEYDKLHEIAYTGKEIYELFIKRARKWRQDAVLFLMHSEKRLYSSGKCAAWTLGFWSPSAKKNYFLRYHKNIISDYHNPIKASAVAPNNVLLDTEKLLAIAESKGGGSKYSKQGFRPAAYLVTYPIDQSKFVWYFIYKDDDDQEVYTVIINAVTGRVLKKKRP